MYILMSYYIYTYQCRITYVHISIVLHMYISVSYYIYTYQCRITYVHISVILHVYISVSYYICTYQCRITYVHISVVLHMYILNKQHYYKGKNIFQYDDSKYVHFEIQIVSLLSHRHHWLILQ